MLLFGRELTEKKKLPKKKKGKKEVASDDEESESGTAYYINSICLCVHMSIPETLVGYSFH